MKCTGCRVHERDPEPIQSHRVLISVERPVSPAMRAATFGEKPRSIIIGTRWVKVPILAVLSKKNDKANQDERTGLD